MTCLPEQSIQGKSFQLISDVLLNAKNKLHMMLSDSTHQFVLSKEDIELKVYMNRLFRQD